MLEKESQSNCQETDMRYFVIGAIAVIVVVASVSLVPDLVRYIKISSM